MSGHDESAPPATGVLQPSMGAEGGAGGDGEPPRKRPRAADELRRRLLDHKLLRLRTLRDRFTEQLSELYFLQAGGNMMEYGAWRRKPASPALAAFIEARRPAAIGAAPLPAPAAVAPVAVAVPAPDPALDKAKQEAWVARRVTELARAGLWPERRLPRVLEPPRHKTHWDYLLEEMAWLAQDFAHERKWKKQAARKCARAVQKYFQDKAAAAQKAEKAQELQLKKIAAFAAKEIRTFWANVEKLVEWKRVRRVERARKEALDEQLSYMVDRSERYSRALAAGLAAARPEPPSPPPSDYEPGDDSADDESTIAADERRHRDDHAAELQALQQDADLPLDDLVKLYSAPPAAAVVDGETDADTDTDTECSDTDDDSSDRETRADSPDTAPLEELVQEAGEGAGDGGGDSGDGEQRVQAASSLAATLQPTGTTLAETAVATPVPRLLRLPLREYQHVGLHWLATMHQRQLNGILADEMGLGKTIQTIALLAHLALRGDWGPHLVVAPTSVVLNWEMEFKKWCPAFKILTYYGNIKERKLKRVGWTKANTFHVCITSYKLVVQDHQSFRRKRWKYLILDEAQNIKNFKSQRWQMLLNFQTERRLLLTGTPLQNCVVELWSLMHFLMPSVFASAAHFREWFTVDPLDPSPPQTELLNRLHQVLRPFLLRRLKRDVERQLPRKYEHVLLCRLAKRQRALYDDFMSRAKTKETLASGNLLSVINVLMQLRKVCNHPDLFEPRPVTSPLALPAIELRVPALILDTGVRERWELAARLCGDLASLEASGAGAFAAHRARHLAPPRRLVEELAEPPPTPPRAPPAALRLHLRLVARVVPAGLPAAPPPVRAPRPPPAPPPKTQPPAPPTGTAAVRLAARRRAALRRLAVTNERRCWRLPLYGADLRDALVACKPIVPHKDLDVLLEEMFPIIDNFTVCIGGVRAAAPSLVAGGGAAAWRRAAAVAAAAVAAAAGSTLAKLHAPASRQAVAFPHPNLLQYDCGKLQRLGTLLRGLAAGGHRALIFTQMTRVLDVLERFLCSRGLTYLRLDGATKVEQRQVLVDRFNSDPRVFCMILSTRSGGVGLNLTGADTVVFYDSDWNPTMDAQAQDRAHRIGQTRDVHVYRLVTAASVEENILRTARNKRALGAAAIDKGRFTPDTLALTHTNIRDLFGTDSPLQSKRDADSGPRSPDEAELARALSAAEEEADAAAAAAARAEQTSELAEFDDPPANTSSAHTSAPPSNAPAPHDDDPLAAIMDQLTPVEKYAMRVVEGSEAAGEAERAAIDDMKRALTELRPRTPPPPPPPNPPPADVTYCAEDARAQIWSSIAATAAAMPMWCPPTPPSGEGDVYVERWSRALYRRGAADEALLPPPRATPARAPRAARSPARPAPAPPSLFERGGRPARPRPRPAPPPRDLPPPDWATSEDAALRRALRLQRLPPEPPPARAPNWEWLAELVNEVALRYRSARACRDRHDALADPARRKLRKPSAPRRRRDEDAPRPPLARLDALRDASDRRRAAPKRRLDDAAARNPKHAALLHDHGVDYDAPPTPMEVASRRADRIAREKQKAAAAGAAAAGAAQGATAAPAAGPGPPRVVVAGRRADAALLYRAPRPHLKILHHAPAPATSASTIQQQQQAGGEAALRTLQLQQLALRRAAPPRAAAPPAHLVVAHLAPPAPSPAPPTASANAPAPPHTTHHQ